MSVCVGVHARVYAYCMYACVCHLVYQYTVHVLVTNQIGISLYILYIALYCFVICIVLNVSLNQD